MRSHRVPIFFLAAIAAGVVGARVIVACSSGTTDTVNPVPFDAGFDAGAHFNPNFISHVVVIYQENWSFDALYGDLPNVEHAAFGDNAKQTDINGSKLDGIPIPLTGSFPYWSPSPPWAQDWNNFPHWADGGADHAPAHATFFNLDAYNPQTAFDGDLQHTFYLEQAQMGANPSTGICPVAGKCPMDRFLALSNNPGLVLSGRNTKLLPEMELAQMYSVCDNTFHSAFGGSFLNHQYLVAAAAPVWTNTGDPGTWPSATDPNVPGDATGMLKNAGAPVWVQPTHIGAAGNAVQADGGVVMTQDGGTVPAYLLTKPTISPDPAKIGDPATYGCTDTSVPCVNWPAPINPLADAGTYTQAQWYQMDTHVTYQPDTDGYYRVINTTQPAYWPFQTGSVYMPPATNPHIGDLLGKQPSSPSWKWYSQGWNQAVNGNPDRLFQFHHQPFNYFKNLRPGTAGRVAHLADYTDLEIDLAQGTLPAVSFVKFQGEYNSHPGYAQIVQGSKAVASLVSMIQKSSSWATTAIILTYDEHGGRWDHKSPPPASSKEKATFGHTYGPGSRVPFVVISPYAKLGYVSKHQYETVSILKFIERRWVTDPTYKTIGDVASPPQYTRDQDPNVGDLTDDDGPFTNNPTFSIPVYDAGSDASTSTASSSSSSGH